MAEFIAVSSDFIPTERPDAEQMLYNTTMTPFSDPMSSSSRPNQAVE
jgi:hypothetical protein